MNTENLKLDPSAALPSYRWLRMTFHKEGKGGKLSLLSRGSAQDDSVRTDCSDCVPERERVGRQWLRQMQNYPLRRAN